MPLHTLQELQTLTRRALENAGASAAQAEPTARALVAAEAQGLASHGLARVPMYVGHMEAGRVVGNARPRIQAERAGAVLIDAGDGFAFAACELAVGQAIARARVCGIAIGAVTNSHHFGVAAHHLEAVAAEGLVGLAFGNAPAAMPAAGGRRALFGTNPIAAVFPRQGAKPVTVDLSLSEVARGKLMLAAKKGEAIPLGWALDAQGNPTTDPAKGLEGSMLPAGGAKGAMLALIVELLVTSLTGAQFGAQADSFFVKEGNRPKLGQAFIVVDPSALSGSATYFARVEALMSAMLADAGVRVPGYRRFDLALRAQSLGIDVPEATLVPIRVLAGMA
ncbi:Ldh family oxidoreductase [Verminephrobacter aporrectodeae]|uniref:Ldh family oxidoreductase n=1 Tax=Verminephrobacter aporrectodeae TaxID=1110389 RepID=UPI0022431655|nr:Ldh family oxidoreductase [Verminephrobacter aporrectodeae]MCW8175843.1 Ldh family oxidoreductase [Verminephrobacter aporrectodeae subsp. tuberculatae]MCW8203538.1 Ldh family oxidoreductase [Verminephrobacter aporrectodeae subsp. tuberculatae]